MIRKELIATDVDLTTKDQIFNFIADRALELELIDSKEEFIDKLYYREGLMSTALDFNLAIPHAKSDAIKEDFVAFIKLSNDIKWNEDDENSTNQVFLIAVGEGGSDRHLKYIAQISRKIIDDDFRQQLINAKSVDEIYSILSGINKEK